MTPLAKPSGIGSSCTNKRFPAAKEGLIRANRHPFLGHVGDIVVISRVKGIVSADHPIRLPCQFMPERLVIPDAIENEMVQTVVSAR